MQRGTNRVKIVIHRAMGTDPAERKSHGDKPSGSDTAVQKKEKARGSVPMAHKENYI